jgi:hypothetical protein
MNTFFEDKLIDGVLDTMSANGQKRQPLHGAPTGAGAHGHSPTRQQQQQWGGGSPNTRINKPTPDQAAAAEEVRVCVRACACVEDLDLTFETQPHESHAFSGAHQAWDKFAQDARASAQTGPADGQKSAKDLVEEMRSKRLAREESQPAVMTILDPEAPGFERQGNAVYEVRAAAVYVHERWGECVGT